MVLGAVFLLRSPFAPITALWLIPVTLGLLLARDLDGWRGSRRKNLRRRGISMSRLERGGTSRRRARSLRTSFQDDSMITSLADLDRIRDECRSLVTNRALMSAGAAVVPIPGMDLVADIGLLTTLLPQISERFDLDHEQVEKMEPHVAQQVFVMASSMGNTLIGRMVTKRIVALLLRRIGARLAVGSVAKFVPFAGSALAASISFGAMKLVGNAHIEDCYQTARALIEKPATLARA
jgi:uncharacterized protein (DUF697 family)